MYLPRSNIRRILALTIPGGISLGLLLYALITIVNRQFPETPTVTLLVALLFGGVIGIALAAAAWMSLRYALSEMRRHATTVLQADLPPLTDNDPLVSLRQTVSDAIAAVPHSSTLAMLAQRFGELTDRDTMITVIAEYLSEHLAVQGAILLLHDAERGVLIPTSGWGIASVNRTVTFDKDGSALGRALRERRVARFSSVQMRSLLATTSPQSLTVVSWPLWIQQAPLGVLCLMITGTDVRLNDEQEQFVTQAVNLLAIQLQAATYRQWCTREQRRLDAFDRVITSVIEQPSLERALTELLQIAAEVTESSHGTFLLIDPEANVIRARITLNEGNILPLNVAAAPILKHGLAGWVLRTQRGVIIDDIERDTRWIPTPGLELMRSALAMPLFHGDRPLGVLTLADPMPYRYSRRSLALVAALAAYAVSVMVHHRYEGIVEPAEVVRARRLLSAYLAPETIRELMGNRSRLMQALQPQVMTATLVYGCLRGIERLTDMTVHQLIERITGPFHSECRAIVHQLQGAYIILDERSFCAAFGFPQPRFDDATRALQAAQQIQAAVPRLRLRWQQELGVDVTIAGGVTTGQLAVGVIEDEQIATLVWTGTAMCEVRRLYQLARNDEIIVGDSVLKMTNVHQFTLDPLAPVSLSNGDDSAPVYRLVSSS
ncbi:GAF domain-containing protein [Chloroflexus sp.]|uniref:GAF domain-containing protein n=1 Tax=Chloroflexus sp. TaxID=1904827 RepID=UPI003C71FA39